MSDPNAPYEALLLRGGECLSLGQAAEARELLEEAQRVRPDEIQCLNLLGLAYFKLNLFEKAQDIYVRLVAQSPSDCTLRVNLGLVYLKVHDLVRARREFEAALHLDSTHVKAHKYLAMTYAHAGEYGKAREHFLMAGNEDMAGRMEANIKEPDASVQEATTSDVHEVVLTFEEPMATSEVELPREPSSDAPTREVRVEPEGFTEVPVLVWPGWTEGVSRQGPGPQGGAGPFETGPGSCVVGVRGAVHGRMEGWVCLWGDLAVEPLLRKKGVELLADTVGGGPCQMFLLHGEGAIHFSAKGRSFEVLPVSPNGTCFREEAVFSFESRLSYENERLEGAPPFWVMTLKGPGQVLVAHEGVLQVVEVRPETPVSVPVPYLVAWEGNLQPRLLSSMGPAVQFVGSGFVLFAVPAPGTPRL